MSRKKCPNCQLISFDSASQCPRCDADIAGVAYREGRPRRRIGLTVRIVSCLVACTLAIAGFYVSLLATSKPLDPFQSAAVRDAIDVLRERGFASEADQLSRFAAFRSTDNWLNAASPKENAYAATNFPFAIITLYSDFFTYPVDDVERAAILLHESRHILGKNENDAYKFVWLNRHRLGWTEDRYFMSPVWSNVRAQTREEAPELFRCADVPLGDCTAVALRSVSR